VNLRLHSLLSGYQWQLCILTLTFHRLHVTFLNCTMHFDSHTHLGNPAGNASFIQSIILTVVTLLIFDRSQEVVSAKNGGAMIGASKVGHIAHLAGAVMGVALILLLQKLPEPKGKQLP
jgi:membrane associated rhomboid family serine protease